MSDTSQISSGALAPVTSRHRISSIDVLRGFAVLNLLPIHLNGYAAISDSLISDATTGLNGVAYYYSECVAGTMFGLFAMLFGAGVILLSSRAESSGRGGEIGDIYYRRLLWLLVFGVVHQYIILWSADILYWYAICGLFLFPMRKLSPRVLLFAGLVVLAVWIPKTIVQQHTEQDVRAMAAAADAKKEAGEALTVDEKRAQRRWAEMNRTKKDPSDAQQEIDKYNNLGYWAYFRESLSWSVPRQSKILYLYGFYSCVGLMLIGMAFMKMGLFSAKKSLRLYMSLLFIGYGIGLGFRAFSAHYYLAYHDKAHYYDTWARFMFNDATWEFVALLVAMGHIGSISLIFRSRRVSWFVSSFAAAGRMALTNYVLQSVVITLLFHSYGLGLWSHVERYQTFYVVAIVWTIQLTGSYCWLKHFRFGPLEWMWRSLTYWKPQPMVVQPATASPSGS